MSNNYKHISVVVQGPVQAYQGRAQQAGITHQCLQSIRQHLPGATIILSTWEGQNCDGLEPDILLLNKDPGGTIASYKEDGTPYKLNFNRQIFSSSQGLKQVNTDYAIKLRSDNFLTGNQFVAIQQAYPKRVPGDIQFSERVVVNSSYFRGFANGMPVVMHPSDFFHYGRTEDVMKIWDIPLFDDFQFDASKLGRKQYRGAPKTAPYAEQVYCDAWLRQLQPSLPELEHRHHADQQMIDHWQRFVASNFIMLEPNQIGLGLIDRFIPTTRRVNELTHEDWKFLYQKYCDPNFPVSHWRLFHQIGWRRMFKFPISRLKHSIKPKR